VAGLVVIGASPRRVLDSSYRSFLALIRDRIATSLATCRASEAEKRRAETAGRARPRRTVVDTMPDRFFASTGTGGDRFNAPSRERSFRAPQDPAAFIGKVVWEEFPNHAGQAVFPSGHAERLPINRLRPQLLRRSSYARRRLSIGDVTAERRAHSLKSDASPHVVMLVRDRRRSRA